MYGDPSAMHAGWLYNRFPGIKFRVSFGAVYYLVSNAPGRAFETSDKIQRSDMPLDIGAITALLSQQFSDAKVRLLNIEQAFEVQ